jgi:hypothetical protein
MATGNLFAPCGPEQMVHEIATPLIAVRDGKEEFASGSAVIVGRGYAITAYHVIEDFVRRFEGEAPPLDGFTPVSFEILAFITLDKGKRTVPLKVLRTWAAEPLDLAVLAIGVPEDFPDDHRWKVPRISLLPPKVGTPIVGFGFADASITRTPGDPHPTLHSKPSITMGEVVEVHHELRDRGRLRFPCFRVDARFDGGMSGGPVFNNCTGHLCGVICSSMPAACPDEHHISYASTIWPIVGTLVDDPRLPSGRSERRPLYEIFVSRLIPAVDLKRVRLVRAEDGKLHPQAGYDRNEWEAPVGM